MQVLLFQRFFRRVGSFLLVAPFTPLHGKASGRRMPAAARNRATEGRGWGIGFRRGRPLISTSVVQRVASSSMPSWTVASMARQRRVQFARDQVGQHHDKGVAARARLQPHVHRSHLEFDGFAGAKGPLHKRQVFVARMDGFLVGDCGRQVGFDYVAAVEFGLFGQPVFVDGQRERAVFGVGRDLDPRIDPQLFGAFGHAAAGRGEARPPVLA